jgi:CRISPR-associated protein Csd2
MDIVFLFDVVDGNPNGDPDADNAPRIDPITQNGLVTDVCLKRKLRNYVVARKSGETPNAIFVTDGAILAATKQAAYVALGQKVEMVGDKVKRSGPVIDSVRQYMCANYWDIRTFGAVMNTDVPAGTVRGPVQLTFARSISPIDPSLWTITRMAVETDKEAKDHAFDNKTMGRKYTVPYALYRAHMFITPGDAAKTGFNSNDLKLLRDGLNMMFETDRASGRGLMTMRAIQVFHHDCALGRAQAGRLFDRITVKLNAGRETPSCFADYTVDIQKTAMPEGVTMEDWLV